MQDVDALAADVLDRAKRRGVTIVTAESCTAGLLAAAFSRAPGALRSFHGGFVAYTKDQKRALGVPRDMLDSRGAVNEEVALAMVKGALARSPATVSVAITGVAGPEPDEDGNPIGLVYCAVAHRGDTLRTEAVRLECASKERDAILREAMIRALILLRAFCFEEARV